MRMAVDLPGAVLADDGVNGAGLDRDVDVVVGENAAEALGDVSKLDSIYWNIASVTLISPAMILRFGLFGGRDGFGRQQISVVLVDDVADAVALEAEDVQARP